MSSPTTPRPAPRLRTSGPDDCHGGSNRPAAEVVVEAATSAPSPAMASTGARLLTAEDVAAAWQVSVSLIYKLRREGRLPFVRIGTLYRFDPEVIRAYARGAVVPPRRVR